MAHIDWSIEAREFINCNCAYGCPCQFNARPTYGDCYGVGAYDIERGHFGDVTLDGLSAAMVFSWPGAIHEGDGTMQLVIDERANEAQRDALRRIMHGEETEPMATMWQVFSTTMSTVHDPVYAPIEFQVDVDARTARLVIPAMIEAEGEPIRNPVTGHPHRARIDLPHGFEYRVAEMGSGTAQVSGAMPLEVTGSYAQLARIHLTSQGIPAGFAGR